MVDAAWVALSLSRHIGGKTLRNLLAYFDHDLNAILTADETTLQEVHGIGAKIATMIQALDVESVQRAIQHWQQAGVSIIPWDDPAYPSPLKSLEDAPPTLFMRGDNRLGWGNSAAIIGTRRPTPAARHIALRLGACLAEMGYTVISGLAVGIDTAGHQGALSNPDGYTAAVLGSGVLNIYPLENVALAGQIIQRGLLISEVHPYLTANAPRLVARNRLISGLSRHIIVVETAADGGAMYAARFAQAQGHPVHAVDLPASGNQQLIQDGAGVIPPDFKQLPF